jgi:beta-mannosidase
VTLQAAIHSATRPTEVTLVVDGREAAGEIREDAPGWLVRAALRVLDPPLWWPHTHGAQPLVDCSLRIDFGDGCHILSCGRTTGFRRLFAPPDGGISLHVNDVPVYCRGACWTVSDVLTLTGTEEKLARDLRLARDAGVNMLRVGGTMVYESDAFYRLCDELGILVWQDFMFANMDYPVEDADFAAEIEAEARCQLSRLSPHPCIAVWCGNSEVEQQAAMVGVPRELWRNDWFASRLPALCAEYSPEVPYVPSSPSGGALPFHVREGVSHYYGVGAYLRSPQELRRDDVKFTPECLALDPLFGKVPGQVITHAVESSVGVRMARPIHCRSS